MCLKRAVYLKGYNTHQNTIYNHFNQSFIICETSNF